MKRIFIAIKVEPDAALLEMISSLKSLLAAESIKWVDPSSIHLTIAFLGNTDEKRIKILNSMLNYKCPGFNEFEFILAGTGVFKNIRDPRVIWAGIRSSGRLSDLNVVISAGLKETGFNIEERPFKPHLTLGRVKSVKNTENLKFVLDKYSETEFQTVLVKEVILFESILQQTGPVYKPLGRFSL
ncbi:MAG: RNA 2',3'-cyclic phosphodiesterase [Bacteroidales bacterium]